MFDLFRFHVGWFVGMIVAAGMPALLRAEDGALTREERIERLNTVEGSRVAYNHKLQQGRGYLRSTHTCLTDEDVVVEGQVAFVAGGDSSRSLAAGNIGFAEDLWVRIGHAGENHRSWDIQLGRYRPSPLFNTGDQLDILEARTPTDRALLLRYHESAVTWARPENSLYHVGIHYEPTGWLRMEAVARPGPGREKNVRTTALLQLGPLSLRLGVRVAGEPIRTTNADRRDMGMAGAFQLEILPALAIGIQGGLEMVQRINRSSDAVPEKLTQAMTLGGYWIVKPLVQKRKGSPLSLGAGVNRTDTIRFTVEGEKPANQTNVYVTLQFRVVAGCFLQASAGYLQARSTVGKREYGFDSSVSLKYTI